MRSTVSLLLLLALLTSCAHRATTQPPFSVHVEPTENRSSTWAEAVLWLWFENHTKDNITLDVGVSGGRNIHNFDNLSFSAERNGHVYQAVFKMHSLRYSRPMVAIVPANGKSKKMQVPLSLLVWRNNPKLAFELPGGRPYPAGTQMDDYLMAESILPPPGVYSCQLGYSSELSATEQESIAWSDITEIGIGPGAGEQENGQRP